MYFAYQPRSWWLALALRKVALPLAALLAISACTLITDVDRARIPTDLPPEPDGGSPESAGDAGGPDARSSDSGGDPDPSTDAGAMLDADTPGSGGGGPADATTTAAMDARNAASTSDAG